MKNKTAIFISILSIIISVTAIITAIINSGFFDTPNTSVKQSSFVDPVENWYAVDKNGKMHFSSKKDRPMTYIAFISADGKNVIQMLESKGKCVSSGNLLEKKIKTTTLKGTIDLNSTYYYNDNITVVVVGANTTSTYVQCMTSENKVVMWNGSYILSVNPFTPGEAVTIFNNIPHSLSNS